MKNPVPNAALPRPSWKGDCLPNAVIRALIGECPVLRLSVIHADGRDQTVHDLTGNTAFSLDLIEG